MLLWLLGAVFLIGAIASYYFGERNVVAPVVLFLGTWTACLGLAAYNQHLWGFRLSPATFAVIGLGGLEFVAVSYLVRHWFHHRYGAVPAMRGPQPRHDIGLRWLLGIDAVIGVTFVAYFARVLAIIPEAPSLGERLRLFKEQTSISHTAVLPRYVGQLFRLSQILAFVLAYLLATYLASGRPRQRRDRIAVALQLAGLSTFCVTLFLSSDRLAIVALLLGFVACWALLWQRRRGVEGLTRRFAIWAGLMGVVLLVAFYLVAPLIGRNRSESPLAYIALYGGGAIALLNDFLQNRPPSVPVPGLESFYTLNLKLHNLGLTPPLDPYPPIHLENRYQGNVQMGNVYTAYRRWLYDFGYLGAAVLQGLMALVLNVVFCINRHLAGKDRAFWMVLYAFTLYSIIFHPVDSYFTMQFVSQTFCITLVLMKLVSVVVLRRPKDGDEERKEKKTSAQTSGNRVSALAMSTQATSSLKLNAGMNMVLQFSIIFIPLITYPYVTRTLFEQGMGKAQVALNIVGYFAMIAQVGIPTYGVTACARVRDDLPKLRQTAKELLALSLGFSLLAYLLLAAVVLAVPALRADWLIYVVISSQILLQAVGVDWLFKALEQYTYLTLVNLGIRLAMLAATFIFVRGPGDAVAFGLISVLSLAGSGVLNIIRARGLLTGT
ncbi:MAG: oligosaccharide repeat unit polymerase, partial [Propionibacteriaceae bacterium]